MKIVFYNNPNMDVKIPLLINSQSKRSFSGCKMFSWHQDINSSIFISSCTSPGGCSCPPAPKTRQRMARGRRLRPLGPKRPRWPKPPAPALASPILRESWENGATPNIWDYIPMLHAPDIIGKKVYALKEQYAEFFITLTMFSMWWFCCKVL